MNKKGLYPHTSLKYKNENGNEIMWTYSEWNDIIQLNFEKYFYVTTIEEKVGPDYENIYINDTEHINQRGIYKDTYGSSNGYTDYQLRPNFGIAMCAAPELFNKIHANYALENVLNILQGPVGLATLDPSDWSYNGKYHNGTDSEDYSTSKGFNYHQGPEWTWVLGPFLRARLLFSENKQVVADEIMRDLDVHRNMLATSDWRGLPELTNKNGEYCRDSCPTQAWSMACLLEVLFDIQKLDQQM